jgi:hypothetical protein
MAAQVLTIGQFTRFSPDRSPTALHRHRTTLTALDRQIGPRLAPALRSGFTSRRAAAAFREAQASASQSEAPETAPFVEKKQSRPALLLVVRTVSAAEEQELLRYRWLSSGLLRSAAC